MTDFDTGPIASSMFGMIGLGITAGVALGLMRMTSDELRYQREREDRYPRPRDVASHYNQPYIRPPKMTRDRHQSNYYFNPYGSRY